MIDNFIGFGRKREEGKKGTRARAPGLPVEAQQSELTNAPSGLITALHPWLTILLLPGLWACRIVLSEENSLGFTWLC